MSVQFGKWNFEGPPPAADYIEKVGAALAPYGPDSNETYSNGGVRILYRAFHTTKESRRETQPHISPSGAVITWDGRLDNRAELINELRDCLTITSTDLAIVAAAYEKWHINCFAKLIGDWALSVWNPLDKLLTLAQDPVGPRHLYYTFDKDQVTWSTILDPLILRAGKSFTICEEYVAGWLSYFPATHLTPYLGIHAVPPSSFVLLRPANHTVREYWDFDPGKRIRYGTDAEYEEHFRAVFAKAVQRRLRSDTPILAELSGGRDSSSIVCMADAIIANAVAETPRLDTVSYYDDSEPNNGNEWPYFTQVEEKRGRTGLHINVGPEQKTDSAPNCESNSPGSLVIPNFSRRLPELGNWLVSQGNRVVLSGIGGDEVMGGVPVPTPELQDLIAKARLGALAHQLKAWALQKRKPWFHLFFEAARGFFPPGLVGVPNYIRPAGWLQSKFVKCHWPALTGYPSRVKLFGPPACFQDDMSTLNCLRRQLACKTHTHPIYEMRYPYLDRDLLEFMYAVPREQSVRPTQRRSLMRRALVGLVPEQILNRKGKGLAIRAPLVQIRNDWANLVCMTQQMLSSSLGIVDSERFLDALQKGRRGEEVPTASIVRLILFEGWLGNVRALGIVDARAMRRPQTTLQTSV